MEAAFDADSATCKVTVRRKGLLQALGHDLCFRVSRFRIDVSGSNDSVQVRAAFEASSLVFDGVITREHSGVRTAPTPSVSASDQRSIEARIRDEVLSSRLHPHVRFEADAISPKGSRFTIDGRLTIRDRTRTIRAEAELSPGETIVRCRVHQPDFGIPTVRALLGMLELEPDVEVVVRVPRLLA